jgi:hypothetical protein
MSPNWMARKLKKIDRIDLRMTLELGLIALLVALAWCLAVYCKG